MGLVHEEQEPIEWKELPLGAERRVNCQHMKSLLTTILQQHWQWQENRQDAWILGFFRCKTAFVPSLDAKTAFGVEKPSCGVYSGSTFGRDEGREVFRMLREL